MKQHKTTPTPVVPTEQQCLDDLTHLQEALGNMGQLRQSLHSLRDNGFAMMPESRRLKVQPEFRETFSKPQQIVPVIRLCGNWLQQAGFDYNSHVRIITLHQLLIVCPEKIELQPGKLRRMV
jgi:hypothetical protein